MEDYKKKYKEALMRAKGFKTDEYKDVAEYIFPELRESEYERIKKEITELVMQPTWKTEKEFHRRKELCAWLEKQGKQKHQYISRPKYIGEEELLGEQKPADKVEPKFKIGDIIRLKDGDGLEWTVEGVLNNGYYTIVCADRDDFIQLDDKWELVEQKPAWSEEDKDVIDTIIWTLIDREVKEGHPDKYEPEINWLKSLKGRVQPKQEWSKLDNRIEDCIGMCLTDISEKRFDDFKTSLKECLDWLHSLKDRIWYQPSQEWSEEDKRKIYRIYSILRQAADTHAFSTSCRLIGDKECIELQDFLKSLRPHSQWKPSDEQMKALWEVYKGGEEQAALASLYSDLKRLLKI